MFNLACKLVEDLLTQLYDDYKKYTDKKGLFISKLELKRIEGLNNLVNNSTFSLNNPNTKKSLVKQKIKWYTIIYQMNNYIIKPNLLFNFS